MRSASLPGTKHHTSIDRREPRILAALQSARGVKKLTPSWIEWTGTSRRRLRLRAGLVLGIVEAWLYFGAHKRRYVLFIEAGLDLQRLRESLAAAVGRFGIAVDVLES